jgi:hypothetical protein
MPKRNSTVPGIRKGSGATKMNPVIINLSIFQSVDFITPSIAAQTSNVTITPVRIAG